ncbi:hypothetical protein ACOM2C_05645 [Pseudarthrobacter sp. So.54]
MTIPQGAATGTWNVTLYPLSDTLGNSSTNFQDLATINVTAVPDKSTLTAAPAPKITGITKVGSTLTVAPGTWSPVPVGLSYQWYRSGTAITGATSVTYKPTATDTGTTLTVRVTGRKSGYTTTTRTSPATAPIAAGTLSAPAPKITGIAKVGSTLTVTSGTWSPAPVGLSYQWYRSGTAITGATAVTYKPTATDAGKTLTARVTGRKSGYTTASRTSPATLSVSR